MMLLYYAMINIGRDQGIYKCESDKEISLVLLHVENESTDGGTATADLRERDIAVDLLTEEKNPPVGKITMHPLGLAPFAGLVRESDVADTALDGHRIVR